MTTRSGPRPGAIIALLTLASFTVVFNSTILIPLLPEISDALHVRIALGGQLMTAYALVAGTASLLSGPTIDRVGRRPVMTAGILILVVARVVAVVAPNFWVLLGARALAGLGAGWLLPASLAAAGDYFPYRERGRVMAWVLTGTTVAPIIGLPLGAFIAGAVSWRLTFLMLAVIAAALAIMLRSILPAEQKREINEGEGAPGPVAMFRTVLGDKSAVSALLSDFLGFSYWYVITIFMGAFFHEVFGMPTWALGLVTVTYGFGMLIGGNAGGRLSDRLGKRPVILAAGTGCTVLGLLLTTVVRWEVLSVAILLLFATHNGARVVSARALLTQMSPKARGTVMSVNAAGIQFATVAGSLLGGLAIELGGYMYLGPVAALVALLATAVFAGFVREPERLVREQAVVSA